MLGKERNREERTRRESITLGGKQKEKEKGARKRRGTKETEKERKGRRKKREDKQGKVIMI